MKIVFICTILFVVTLVQNVKADQLAWITKDQAEQTVQYFNDNDIKTIVLFCGCCDKDVKMKVSVDKVFYRKTENPDYYEVVIQGNASDGSRINEGVDLAYVHVLRDSKWRCLGKELGFKCDPCTKAFKY
jgi:hypothetical protein